MMSTFYLRQNVRVSDSYSGYFFSIGEVVKLTKKCFGTFWEAEKK